MLSSAFQLPHFSFLFLPVLLVAVCPELQCWQQQPMQLVYQQAVLMEGQIDVFVVVVLDHGGKGWAVAVGPKMEGVLLH